MQTPAKRRMTINPGKPRPGEKNFKVTFRHPSRNGKVVMKSLSSPLKKGQKTLPNIMLFVGIADTIVRAGRSEFNGDGRRPQ